MNNGPLYAASGAMSREEEYQSVIQSLITSTKLLQEATKASTLPVFSGSLLEVAIDQLEKLKVILQLSVPYFDFFRLTLFPSSHADPSNARRYSK